MQFCEFFKNQFTALRCVKYNLDYYLLILFAVIDFQPFTVSIHISERKSVSEPSGPAHG